MIYTYYEGLYYIFYNSKTTIVREHEKIQFDVL
jgi:hypothetical protein